MLTGHQPIGIKQDVLIKPIRDSPAAFLADWKLSHLRQIKIFCYRGPGRSPVYAPQGSLRFENRSFSDALKFFVTGVRGVAPLMPLRAPAIRNTEFFRSSKIFY